MPGVGLSLRSSRVVLRERGKLVITPARLVLNGTRIERVERPPFAVESVRSTGDGAARGPDVDLGDRLVTPAFVNAHTHLGLSFLRRFNYEIRSEEGRILVEELAAGSRRSED